MYSISVYFKTNVINKVTVTVLNTIHVVLTPCNTSQIKPAGGTVFTDDIS